MKRDIMMLSRSDWFREFDDFVGLVLASAVPPVPVVPRFRAALAGDLRR